MDRSHCRVTTGLGTGSQWGRCPAGMEGCASAPWHSENGSRFIGCQALEMLTLTATFPPLSLAATDMPGLLEVHFHVQPGCHPKLPSCRPHG